MPEFCVPQKIHFYDRRNGGATFPSPNSKSDLAVKRAFLTRTQNRAPLLEVTLSQTVQGTLCITALFDQHRVCATRDCHLQRLTFKRCSGHVVKDSENVFCDQSWVCVALPGYFFHVSFFAQPVLIFLRTWARSDWLATWKLHNWVFTRIKKRNCQCFMCLIQ
jgi:hypothetical protein